MEGVQFLYSIPKTVARPKELFIINEFKNGEKNECGLIQYQQFDSTGKLIRYFNATSKEYWWNFVDLHSLRPYGNEWQVGKLAGRTAAGLDSAVEYRRPLGIFAPYEFKKFPCELAATEQGREKLKEDINFGTNYAVQKTFLLWPDGTVRRRVYWQHVDAYKPSSHGGGKPKPAWDSKYVTWYDRQGRKLTDTTYDVTTSPAKLRVARLYNGGRNPYFTTPWQEDGKLFSGQVQMLRPGKMFVLSDNESRDGAIVTDTVDTNTIRTWSLWSDGYVRWFSKRTVRDSGQFRIEITMHQSDQRHVLPIVLPENFLEEPHFSPAFLQRTSSYERIVKDTTTGIIFYKNKVEKGVIADRQLRVQDSVGQLRMNWRREWIYTYPHPDTVVITRTELDTTWPNANRQGHYQHRQLINGKRTRTGIRLLTKECALCKEYDVLKTPRELAYIDSVAYFVDGSVRAHRRLISGSYHDWLILNRPDGLPLQRIDYQSGLKESYYYRPGKYGGKMLGEVILDYPDKSRELDQVERFVLTEW